MKSTLRRVVFRAGCLVFVIGSLALTASAQSANDPFASLKRLGKLAARAGQGGYQQADASAVAAQLASIFQPIAGARTAQAIGQLLTNEQRDWQSSQKRGVNEEKLLKSLNRLLDVEKSPEYLQLQLHELRRIRVLLWTQVPDLSGPPKKPLTQGDSVIGPQMSPFEAFVATEYLVFQKDTNPDFLRTVAEIRAGRGRGVAAEAAKPGLHARQIDPRELEFHQKIEALWAKKGGSTESIVATIQQVLEESRND